MTRASAVRPWLCALYIKHVSFTSHFMLFSINILFNSALSCTLLSSASDSAFRNFASDAYKNGSPKCFVNKYMSTYPFDG